MRKSTPGVAYEKVSARLYYAPRYYGRDASALYGEINAAHKIADRLLLLAHAGAFRSKDLDVYGNVPEYVFDARLGLGVDFDRFNVQLSWVGISAANAGYPVSGVRSRNGPVLSISWLF